MNHSPCDCCMTESIPAKRARVILKAILINGVAAAPVNIDMPVSADGYSRHLTCERIGDMLPQGFSVKKLKPLIFTAHSRCSAACQNDPDDFLANIHEYRLFYCGIDPANVSL